MKTIEELWQENTDLLHPDCSAFMCGEGWASIIEYALVRWRAEVKNSRIARVKEKMGTLRIQAMPPVELAARKIHWEALQLSSTTCENCGKPGTLTYLSNSVATLCHTCETACDRA